MHRFKKSNEEPLVRRSESKVTVPLDSRYLKQLPSKKGFAYNYLPAPIDRTALKAVAKVCGEDACRSLLTTWHRAKPSVEFVRENLLKYGENAPTMCRDSSYLYILHQVMEEFRPQEPLIPDSLGKAYKRPDFPRNKSPGLPWILGRDDDNKRLFPDKMSVLGDDRHRGNIQRMWDDVGRGRSITLPDCAAYNRVIVSTKDKNKVRPTWGYPVEVVVEEARFFYPAFDHIKKAKTDHCYGIGCEVAVGGMTYIDDMAKGLNIDGYVGVLSDWSGFDTSIPAWIIRDIFWHMEKWFVWDKVCSADGRVWPVNAAWSLRRFRKLVNYFINTPIRLSDGTRYRKGKGVPSGSMFTNLMDTLINAVVTRYLTYHTTGELPRADLYYGDDSVVVLRSNVSLVTLEKLAKEKFGMALSSTKTTATSNANNFHWLGYYNRQGKPERDFTFMFASFIFPERICKTPIETVARAIGNMYSTCDEGKAVVWHYIIEEILEYAKLQYSEVLTYIQENFRKSFKYLETAGWSAEDIVQPRLYDGVVKAVPAVRPGPPRRTFRGRRHDIMLWNYPYDIPNYEPG